MRPCSSTSIATGEATRGSLAKSSMRKSSASWNVLSASSGEYGGPAGGVRSVQTGPATITKASAAAATMRGGTAALYATRRGAEGGVHPASAASEFEVLRDAGAALLERVGEQPDAAAGFAEVGVVQVDVQQVDVPGQLLRAGDVGRDDFPCDRQRRGFRIVVNVTVACGEQLRVLLLEQPREQRRGEHVAGLDPALVVRGEWGLLVQPLPQDAQADFPGRHVFHQVEHVVVAEEVRR